VLRIIIIKFGIILYLSLYDFILNIIMFLFIMFLVCSSSIFDIVMMDNEFMYMFAKRLALYSRGLSGRLHVSMVLRCCLSANVPYWPGHMVVRGCDNLAKSYIVHSPLIAQVERYYVESLAVFLIFLSNVPYT
jgi:hypothetical protein